MFQFPGFPSYTYWFSIWYYDITHSEFPHSDICGSRLICSSPQLFAACRVLLRLLMPRHSPCALLRLNFLIRSWRLSSSWLFSLVLLLELSQIIVVWSCLHYFYFFAFCAIFVVLFYQRFLERPSWFSGLFLYNLIIVQSFLNYLFVFFSLLDYSVFHDHLVFTSFEVSGVQTGSPWGEFGWTRGGLKWTRTIDLPLIRRVL